MDIRKLPDTHKLPRPLLPKGDDPGIMPGGGIIPGPIPPIKPDRDRLEFRKRDADKNGVLTSDEYGAGKQKQDEFRRYDRNDDGKVSIREFKFGRFLDKLRKGEIDIKPAPMPFPKFPDGNLPIPMPVPTFPDIKPVPMPFPKIPGLEFPDIKPVPMPFPKGGIHLASEASVGDLVAKVKQAQSQDEI